MVSQQVIEFLRSGYSLRNHGYGWHLYPPGKPVGKVLAVDGGVVDELVFTGVISVSIPYTSAVATLVEQGDPA